MVDAYVVQQAGVTFSALEFRRAQSAYFANQGVISGLVVTPGTNQVSVSAGLAAVRDAQAAPAYYVAEVDVAAIVAIDPAAAGVTRVDTPYVAVNDTAAIITVNGVAVPVGAVYVARASGGAGLPAQYTSLGTLTVTSTGIVYSSTGRAQVEDPTVVGRYLRRDVADTLAAGTGASSPVNATDVVVKSYVDLLVQRDPFQRWYWGGATGYGPVFIPDGGANVPTGAAHAVTMTNGHLYRVNSQYTVRNYTAGAVSAQMLLMINNSLAAGSSGQTYLELLPNQTASIQQGWTYACTSTGNYTVSTGIGCSVPNAMAVTNPFNSPYTEFLDMGPGHF